MKRFPWRVRLKALFSKDSYEVYFAHLTDREREIREMDIWELAGVIQEARVRPNMEKDRIVAEHLLSARIAQIQSKASWGAGILGFLGAIIGAALAFAFTHAC